MPVVLPAVPRPAEAGWDAEDGLAILVLLTLARGVVAHDASVDPGIEQLSLQILVILFTKMISSKEQSKKTDEVIVILIYPKNTAQYKL